MDAVGTVGEVFVERWLDLRRLPLVMDDLGEQAAGIVDHAVTWVARSEGFEPSPLCLLRPLAEAMERIAEAFEALGGELGAAWSDLRWAVAEADAMLEGADAEAAGAVAAVAARLAA